MTVISNSEAGSSVRSKLNATGIRKNNLSATTAPTSTDDTGSGYEVGSIWADVTNDKVYVAIDVTSTAAVWQELKKITVSSTAPTSPATNDLWVDTT